jgi:hypothetical protein
VTYEEMMASLAELKTSGNTDPSEFLRRLDPDAIRERIDTINRERQALLVLLRAASRMTKKGKS